RPLELVGVANVRLEPDRLGAALCRRALELLGLQPHERHAAAASRDAFGGLGADAAGRARDQHGAPGQRVMALRHRPTYAPSAAPSMVGCSTSAGAASSGAGAASASTSATPAATSGSASGGPASGGGGGASGTPVGAVCSSRASRTAANSARTESNSVRSEPEALFRLSTRPLPADRRFSTSPLAADRRAARSWSISECTLLAR